MLTKFPSKLYERVLTHRIRYQASCGKQGDILVSCDTSSANITKKKEKTPVTELHGLSQSLLYSIKEIVLQGHLLKACTEEMRLVLLIYFLHK